MKVTILGCGSSGGVPTVGGGWGDCDPAEPRNRRMRASILVEQDGTSLLVDTSPDCRAQLLAAEVTRLDAVLFTHAHADHTHGIDELRWINVAMKADLPAHMDPVTLDRIRTRFGYAFEPLRPEAGGYYYKPTLTPMTIDGPFRIGKIDVIPFEQDHGRSTTLGFRFGKIAYSTDLVDLNQTARDTLAGVDTWIVDAFRRDPHPTHTHLAQTLTWIEDIKPRRAVITHMGSALDYRTLCDEVPDGVEPAYDGLVVEV